MKMQVYRIGFAVDERAIMMIRTNVEGMEMDKDDIWSRAVTCLVGIANNDDGNDDNDNDDNVAAEALQSGERFVAPLERP